MRVVDTVKKLISTKTAVEALVLFIAFVLLCNGKIAGAQPFGYGLYLAVCIAGGSMAVGSVLFAVSGALIGFSIPALVIAPSLAAFGLGLQLILKRLKAGKKLRIAVTVAAGLPAYGLMLWLFGAEGMIILISVLFAGGASAFLAFALPVLAGSRSVRTFNSAGLAVLCFAAFVGLSDISLGGFSFAVAAFGAAVLFIGYIASPYAAAAAGFLAGLGMSVATGDISYLALCSVSAAAGAAFSRGYRPLSALAIMLGYVMCALYFSAKYQNALWALAALGSAAVIYVAIPKKAMVRVRDYFRPHRPLAVIETSSGMGRLLPEKVRLISEAFADMGGYLAHIGVTGSEDRETKVLSARLKRYCEGCPRKESCPLASDILSGGGICRRGRSAISDSVVAVGCSYGGQLLKSANETINGIESRTGAAAVEKKAMNAYGQRLVTLSRMLIDLSKSIADEYRYDRKKSSLLQSDLNESGIIAAEAFVTPDMSGTVIVPSDTKRSDLDKMLSRCLNFSVRTVNEGEFDPGWKAVRFARAPRFELAYAFSGRAKADMSGDTYSATVDGSRAMLSLCDGRGSGENAAALSNATLSVIEDYYKAGFDAVETVSCVNSLLAASAGEDFSALDVISVDLATASADIIKAGSPPTFIIKKDSLLRIDGSALPVGALDAARPALSRQMLTPGDVIILVSDGVSDSLPNLGELLGGAQTVNMQKLADDILARAVKSAARDDMSVLAARVIEKRPASARA